MLIKNVSTLLGKELEFVSNTNVKIQDRRFKRIQPNIGSSSKEESIDCEGLLLIPGFVNCHTHIGDSTRHHGWGWAPREGYRTCHRALSGA